MHLYKESALIDFACAGQLFCRLDAALTQPVRVRDCCGDGLVQASGHTNIVDGDAHSG